MSVFYVDFELGDDTKDGTSWANAWKTLTTGATAARIAPGDIIKIAKSPVPYSIGNAKWFAGPFVSTIQAVESSTDATPIVIKSTNHGKVTGNIVQISNHTTNINANGVWKITRVDADKYSLDGSVGSGAGAGGYTGNCILFNGKAVLLSTSGLTKKIDDCDKLWTLANSASVVLEAYASAKQGAGAVKITLPASVATGTKYAYKATGALDLSDYQKVSFWLLNGTAFIADRWKLCLCSDTTGDTIVDTIDIPAIPSNSNRVSLTIARVGGGNLSDSIQSIALYTAGTAPTGSSYLRLDNIIACTTDGLNLQTLISTETEVQGGTHGWYPIQSIDDTIVILDCGIATPSNAGRGYDGAEEIDVATYGRETTKTVLEASTGSATTATINDSGTAGNLIEFQGGYDRVSGLQDGETFVDWRNGCSQGFYSSKDYIKFNYLNAVRSYYGFNVSGNTVSFGRVGAFGCNYIGINLTFLTTNTFTAEDLIAMCNDNDNIYFGFFHFGHITKITKASNSRLGRGINVYQSNDLLVNEIVGCENNFSYGIDLSGGAPYSERPSFPLIRRLNKNVGSAIMFNNTRIADIGVIEKMNNGGGVNGVFYFWYAYGITVKEITQVNNSLATVTSIFNFVTSNNIRIKYVAECNNNTTARLYKTAGSMNCRIDKVTTTGNAGIADVQDGYSVLLNNANCAEAESSFMYLPAHYVYKDQCAKFTNFGNNADDNRIYTNGGSFKSDTTVRHAETGIAWKFSFSNATRNITYPLRFPVARVAFEANKLVTVKAFVRRSADTIGAKLRIFGYSIPGIGLDDLVATAGVNSVGAWEELTLTFTPTIRGVVEVFAEAYYISSFAENAWIDDMTITQAD